MASDFVIVFSENQHYGNEAGGLYGEFHGDDHSYSFSCAGIDTSEQAVFFVEADDIDWRNKIIVNGTLVATTDKESDNERHTENGVIPAGILMATGNDLTIEAVNSSNKSPSDGGTGNLDDFVLDNFVIFYKTATRRRLSIFSRF